MGWRTGVRLTNLAAEFWILCNLEICVSAKPYNIIIINFFRAYAVLHLIKDADSMSGHAAQIFKSENIV